MTKKEAEKYRGIYCAYLLQKQGNVGKFTEMVEILRLANRLYFYETSHFLTFDTYVTTDKELKDIPARPFEDYISLKNYEDVFLSDDTLKLLVYEDTFYMQIAGFQKEILDLAYDKYQKKEPFDFEVTDYIYEHYVDHIENELLFYRDLSDHYDLYTYFMSQHGTYLNSYPNEIYIVNGMSLEFSGFLNAGKVYVKVDHNGAIIKRARVKDLEDVETFLKSL